MSALFKNLLSKIILYKKELVVSLITILLILLGNSIYNHWKTVKLYLPKSNTKVQLVTANYLCQKKTAIILIKTKQKLELVYKAPQINFDEFKKQLFIGLQKEFAKDFATQDLRLSEVYGTKSYLPDYVISINSNCFANYKNENKELETLLKLFFNIIKE
jgi:hypothetical protein